MSTTYTPPASPEAAGVMKPTEGEGLPASDSSNPNTTTSADGEPIDDFFEFIPTQNGSDRVIQRGSLEEALEKLSPPDFCALVGRFGSILPGGRDPSRLRVIVSGKQLTLEDLGRLIRGEAQNPFADTTQYSLEDDRRRFTDQLGLWTTKYNEGFAQARVIENNRFGKRLINGAPRLLDWMEEFESLDLLKKKRSGDPHALREESLEGLIGTVQEEVGLQVATHDEVDQRMARARIANDTDVIDLPKPGEIFHDKLEGDQTRAERLQAMQAAIADLERTSPADLAEKLIGMVAQSGEDNRTIFAEAAETASRYVKAMDAVKEILNQATRTRNVGVLIPNIQNLLRRHYEFRSQLEAVGDESFKLEEPDPSEHHLGEEWPNFGDTEIIFQVAGMSQRPAETGSLLSAIEQMSYAIWIAMTKRQLPETGKREVGFSRDSDMAKISERIAKLIKGSIYHYLTNPPKAETADTPEELKASA